MLIGKETVHEYRGRGTIVAVGNGTVTVRYGEDYDVDFAYPDEFTRMLRLREFDPEAQAEINADLQAARLARAEAYRKQKEEKRRG